MNWSGELCSVMLDYLDDCYAIGRLAIDLLESIRAAISDRMHGINE